MKHVILGNGPAGVVAAETLRGADPSCEIVLVGNEDAPPYPRMAIPYLLEGNIDEAGTYLRKEPGYFERLQNHRATRTCRRPAYGSARRHVRRRQS